MHKFHPEGRYFITGLAPMEGVTNFSMRIWLYLCSQYSFTITPFLRLTEGFSEKSIKVNYIPELIKASKQGPYSIVPQFMASNPRLISKLGSAILKSCNFIDINCGCPASKVVGNMSGSRLIENVDYFYNYLKVITDELGASNISVKMRLGYYKEEEIFALSEVLKSFSFRRVTIHGRTKEQKYKGKANWALIENTAKMLKYDVVGSGDICDVSHLAQKVKDCPSVAQFLIGRGALRNPWIFQEIKTFNKTSISRGALKHALASFILLQQAESSQIEKLIFHFDDILSFSHLKDDEKWFQVSKFLVNKILFLPQMDDYSISQGVERKIFARLKMLWSYMRSSLPNEFLSPFFLRTKSFLEFLENLSLGFDGLGLKSITFKHYKERNKLYSGELK